MPRPAPLVATLLLGLVAGLTPVLALPAAATVPPPPTPRGVALVGGPAVAWYPAGGTASSSRLYRQDPDGWALVAERPVSQDYSNPTMVQDPDLAPGATATDALTAVSSEGESERSTPLTRPVADPEPGPVDALATESYGAGSLADAASGHVLQATRNSGGTTHLSAQVDGDTVSVSLPVVPGPGT